MTRTNVGILRGGPSPEYDVSLKTGAALMQALPEERYDVHDIFIDRMGDWHRRGVPREPIRALANLDVVVNGLHGTYGEDGTVQRILERVGVPYTGARPHAAALSMHKERARTRLKELNVRMPQAVSFTIAHATNTEEMAQRVFSSFGPPYVIKPSRLGSSMGVRIVPTIIDLRDMLADALERYQSVLVEEYIVGKEATVGVIERFRDKDHYALPAIEIIPKDRPFFDHAAKYDGMCEQLCPGSFSHDEKQALEHAACLVHCHIGLAHYSRTDFIVRPNGTVYFLEVNALPGLTESSLLPQALEAVGSSLSEFAEHIIRLARDHR